jgi:AraC-type DNA-binding domain-containing proteins
MNYFNKSLEKEIYKSNKSLLAQVRIFSDTYLLEKVKSLVVERCLDISGDKAISDFFNANASYKSKMESLLRIKESAFNSTINTFDYIDSTYFYCKTNETIVTSNGVIAFNIFDNDRHSHTYINTEIIKKVMSLPKNQYWTTPSENRAFWGNTPYISFSQSIPINSLPEERKGCIIVNINQKMFFKSIDKIYDTNKSSLMIIDSKGRLFAHSDSSKIFEDSKLDGYLKKFLASNDGFLVSAINGKTVGISWAKSTVNEWIYISIVPIETLNKEVFVSRQFILAIVGIIIIFSFMGLNAITILLYKPINLLIRKIKTSSGFHDEGGNELSIINNVINNLSSRVVEMENALIENKQLIKYKLVIDILYNNIKDDYEIKSRLGLIDKYFKFRNYCLVLTEIDNRIFSKLPLDQQEFVTLKITDLINNFFGNKCDCISIRHPSNCIVAIVNFEQYDSISGSLDNLMRLLGNEFELAYNISLSEAVTEILSIGTLYPVTSNYFKYSFIHGYGNIFTSYNITNFESNNGDFDFINSSALEAQIKSCKIRSVKEDILNLVAHIKHGGYSYNYAQSVMLQIINLICKVSHEQGAISTGSEKNEILSDFYDISTLDDCINWIFDLLDSYQEKMNTRNIHINEEFIEKVTEYTCRNIDQQISLNSVAKEFNITPNYLSKIFKDTKGINFSDFVINKKFEKAAELLTTSKTADLSDIAERLGYFNLPHFSKIFKEKYGMTPVQYRKKNIQ